MVKISIFRTKRTAVLYEIPKGTVVESPSDLGLSSILKTSEIISESEKELSWIQDGSTSGSDTQKAKDYIPSPIPKIKRELPKITSKPKREEVLCEKCRSRSISKIKKSPSISHSRNKTVGGAKTLFHQRKVSKIGNKNSPKVFPRKRNFNLNFSSRNSFRRLLEETASHRTIDNSLKKLFEKPSRDDIIRPKELKTSLAKKLAIRIKCTSRQMNYDSIDTIDSTPLKTEEVGKTPKTSKFSFFNVLPKRRFKKEPSGDYNYLNISLKNHCSLTREREPSLKREQVSSTFKNFKDDIFKTKKTRKSTMKSSTTMKKCKIYKLKKKNKTVITLRQKETESKPRKNKVRKLMKTRL